MYAQRRLDKMYGQPTEVLPEDRLEKVLRRIHMSLGVWQTPDAVDIHLGVPSEFWDAVKTNLKIDMQMYVDITKEIDNDDD